MRVAFAVLVLVHALAHGVGFLTQTFLVGVEDTTTNPAFLISGFERDHRFVRLLGVLWLIIGIGFVAAGIGLLQEADWTLPLLVVSTGASTALSIMWVKEAPFGLVANVIIIAILLIPALHDRVLAVGALGRLGGARRSGP
jgi:hypothetical protein